MNVMRTNSTKVLWYESETCKKKGLIRLCCLGPVIPFSRVRSTVHEVAFRRYQEKHLQSLVLKRYTKQPPSSNRPSFAACASHPSLGQKSLPPPLTALPTRSRPSTTTSADHKSGPPGPPSRIDTHCCLPQKKHHKSRIFATILVLIQ